MLLPVNPFKFSIFAALLTVVVIAQASASPQRRQTEFDPSAYYITFELRSNAQPAPNSTDFVAMVRAVFGNPLLGPGLRASVSPRSDATVTTNPRTVVLKSRDANTLAVPGAGVKYYFTDNLFARAGVEADYALDNGKWDYAALVGLGVNFGGNAGA